MSIALIPFHSWLRLGSAALAFGAASPVLAQDRDADAPFVTPLPRTTRVEPSAGQVVGSAVGRAGQRQTSDQIEGIKPMARVDARFTNRVQGRIRNRIDRYYDPLANTTSPFDVAADQVKTADPRRRR